MNPPKGGASDDHCGIGEKKSNLILIKSKAKQSNKKPFPVKFKIPVLLKTLLPRGLEKEALEGLQIHGEDVLNKLRDLLISTRAIFDEGPTKSNYMKYFHHLLWWEEVIARIDLRKYNMAGVQLTIKKEIIVLKVPGLAENGPSLIKGGLVYLRPRNGSNEMFETIISEIINNSIELSNVNKMFFSNYLPKTRFDVSFQLSRWPLECAHEAVSKVFESRQDCRVFPVAPSIRIPLESIDKFYNPLIAKNEEQKSAVEHIVSGTSGKAPYIVFGPPGTGKTRTIVEAIIQIAVRNHKNRVMVCTDSNMASDNIALMLLEYKETLNISNFCLRVYSQSREWSLMPSALAPVSNTECSTTHRMFRNISNEDVAKYRILVTTLLHAAKYGSESSQAKYKLQMSHMFIDEAGQAKEPATLVPVCGLLAPQGTLVLAGDPQQLGPVCMSREANDRGLGESLLERLMKTYDNLYKDPKFITMLVKNFRSDPDILKIPNELFYNNCLQACATPDPLSRISVLKSGGERALVFHAVHSCEQSMGKSPSYFNEKELDMLKRYTKALIVRHKVSPEDIGIVTPYVRQVYKVKEWLASENYNDIEVGTVESFQGKEKRVILVSTVRGKSSLGFLVDDKRFNVILTRAKAKLIIIGNPSCLHRDFKWRKYISLCQEYESYYHQETQQLEEISIQERWTRWRKATP